MSHDDTGDFSLTNPAYSATSGNVCGGGRIKANSRTMTENDLGGRSLVEAQVQAGVQGVAGKRLPINPSTRSNGDALDLGHRWRNRPPFGSRTGSSCSSRDVPQRWHAQVCGTADPDRRAVDQTTPSRRSARNHAQRCCRCQEFLVVRCAEPCTELSSTIRPASGYRPTAAGPAGSPPPRPGRGPLPGEVTPARALSRVRWPPPNAHAVLDTGPAHAVPAALGTRCHLARQTKFRRCDSDHPRRGEQSSGLAKTLQSSRNLRPCRLPAPTRRGVLWDICVRRVGREGPESANAVDHLIRPTSSRHVPRAEVAHIGITRRAPLRPAPSLLDCPRSHTRAHVHRSRAARSGRRGRRVRCSRGRHSRAAMRD